MYDRIGALSASVSASSTEVLVALVFDEVVFDTELFQQPDHTDRARVVQVVER